MMTILLEGYVFVGAILAITLIKDWFVDSAKSVYHSKLENVYAVCMCITAGALWPLALAFGLWYR